MSALLPPELVLGFDEVDRQHRDIFEAMEVAQQAARTGDISAARAAVSSLGDVLVAHFSAEEGYMAESLYPDRARHKAAHDLFMQDFAQLGHELEGGLTDLVQQWIGTRVAEWVKFHIRVNDAPLAEFLAARRFRPTSASARPVKRPSSS